MACCSALTVDGSEVGAGRNHNVHYICTRGQEKVRDSKWVLLK